MAGIQIKPADKAIQTYHETLKNLADAGASTEGQTRRAFGALLGETAKIRNWILIEEETMKIGRSRIRVDGALKSTASGPPLIYGYWEAKDSADDLDAEIRAKLGKGYPRDNIIFEDTQTAVLYQAGKRKLRINLHDSRQLADLLTLFYSYEEPDLQGFENAVLEFQERIPGLGKKLKAIISEAHRNNPKFQNAFDKFFTLCQEALNPNISQEAVDEMLIQHLMTERLMRNVFNRSDFTRKNVIATEVENVIDALTSKSFSREEFFEDVKRFYLAIERAAGKMHGFEQKQDFINGVYEKFFQGYSVKVADTHGIVYTPQEIVDFMCAAVEEVLQDEFQLKISDPGVHILDPCTGTGNFIINLMNRIPRRDLPRVYQNQLFANEVMLLPYYVASLNIEHEFYDLTGSYEAFEGLCFVDTLDLAQGKQLSMFVQENTERVKREKDAPITVIIGNPPYNVGQLNENDNNKNRAYPIIDKRVKETYATDSSATLKAQLYDPYVKFFRWATDRLNGRDGVVCFVSNNSFADQIAFDGMRKHLLQDFTRIYHLDLHGNVRQNPRISGTSHNVFGIQVGVGITVAVRSSEHQDRKLFYHRVPEMWRKEQKLNWLSECIESSCLLPPQGEHESPLPVHGEGSGVGLDSSISVHAAEATHSPLPVYGEGAGVGSKEESDTKIWAAHLPKPDLWEKLKPLARQMRTEPTAAEKKLWQRVRKKQIKGYKVRRQHVIEQFIVDFYVANARLVIEVDGSTHDYTAEEDAIRTEFLESMGLRVIRFTNEDVLKNIEGVLIRLGEVLDEQAALLSSVPHPRPLPINREGSTKHPQEANMIPWQQLEPDKKHTWLIPEHAAEFDAFMPIGSKVVKSQSSINDAIFGIYGIGVKTNRDYIVHDTDTKKLAQRIDEFCDEYNSEVDRYRRKGKGQSVDDFLNYDNIKWSSTLKRHLQAARYAEFDGSKIRLSLYRPFTKKFLYYDNLLNDRPGIFRVVLPEDNSENMLICISGTGSNKPFQAIVVNLLPGHDMLEKTQCFPFYVYDEDGSNRRENITDWALGQFREQYGDGSITKWDIFYYVYGLLHHPGYRERYADSLKKELPRLPFAPDFRAFSSAGKQLADLHLTYESAEEYPLEWVENPDLLPSYYVEKMRLKKQYPAEEGRSHKAYADLQVNDYLTLKGIPEAAFDYRLGNRSALEWVIDQYRVKTDKRSSIVSDPNNEQDEQYIVRLVGQVITVSLKTVEIVNALPDKFNESP